jgi:hypothetical protein
MKCPYDNSECLTCIRTCGYLIEVSEAFKARRPIRLKDRKTIVDRIRRQLPLWSAMVRKWTGRDRVSFDYDNSNPSRS